MWEIGVTKRSRRKHCSSRYYSLGVVTPEHLFFRILNLQRVGMWHALLERRRAKNGEWRKLLVRRFYRKASVFHLVGLYTKLLFAYHSC